MAWQLRRWRPRRSENAPRNSEGAFNRERAADAGPTKGSAARREAPGGPLRTAAPREGRGTGGRCDRRSDRTKSVREDERFHRTAGFGIGGTKEKEGKKK